jgi:hypothetical protein
MHHLSVLFRLVNRQSTYFCKGYAGSSVFILCACSACIGIHQFKNNFCVNTVAMETWNALAHELEWRSTGFWSLFPLIICEKKVLDRYYFMASCLFSVSFAFLCSTNLFLSCLFKNLKWRPPRSKAQALVNMAIDLRVQYNAGIFLTRWGTVSFSKVTLLHVLIKLDRRTDRSIGR